MTNGTHLNTSTGNTYACSKAECASLHYASPAEGRAAYEKMMEAYTLPKPLRKKPKSLEDDFASFMNSSKAKAAPLDRGDWRGDQARAALLNGDLAADQMISDEVSGYYEPDEYEPE
ncbi:hypothetical protein ACFSWE_04010 [Leucobacter albus]|uniref:Uncharacterized protein n=1 Tax=Leucobacter albus TaxID=272210 RepID=A0ABW3TNC4_9MICO